MIEAGNTETRPRSVIRPTSTEGSERDHSTMAARGSTTPVISLKSVTKGHTLICLSSFSPQTAQKFAYAGNMALQCIQRRPFNCICCFIGSRDFILSGCTDLILLLAFYKPASLFWPETVCPPAETHRTTYLHTPSFSH